MLPHLLTDVSLENALIGSYRLHERIGFGGHAVVHNARDTRDESSWAVKVSRNSRKASAHANLLDEGFVLEHARHPNIVRLRERIETDNHHGLVLELLDGITLDRVCEGHETKTIPLQRVVEIGIRICQALHTLHTLALDGRPLRLTHNDVKPGNIMLCTDGRVVLFDMGVSTYAGMHKFIPPGETVGTARYASPETATAQFDRLDGRSDLFMLGGILVELATGRHPFQGFPCVFDLLQAIVHESWGALIDSQEKLRPNAPELIPIVERLLQKEPSNRYASARALENDLTALHERLAGQTGQSADKSRAAFQAWAGRVIQVQRDFPAPAP